jgi:outer membrane protein TolC
VLTQGRLLAISVLSRDTAKAHYEYAHTRASFGLGNRLNELRALDELRSDEAAVAQAEAAVERAREALGVLTGDSQALDVEDGVLLGELPDEEQVSEARLRERPDLQLVQRRRDAAAAVLDDSWRDYLPYLLGTLSAAYQDPATSTIPAATWQAQLVLSLPLYDGGQRYGARRERRALLQEADIAVERALREARAEVRVAFTNLRSAERALTSARASAGAAHDTLALANLAFGGGAVSNLEVIDAERRRRDADVQAAIAEDGVRQARLDVLAAAGLFPTD